MVTELFNKVCEVSKERKKELRRQVKNKTYPPPIWIRNYRITNYEFFKGGGGGVRAGILRGGSRFSERQACGNFQTDKQTNKPLGGGGYPLTPLTPLRPPV